MQLYIIEYKTPLVAEAFNAICDETIEEYSKPETHGTEKAKKELIQLHNSIKQNLRNAEALYGVYPICYYCGFTKAQWGELLDRMDLLKHRDKWVHLKHQFKVFLPIKIQESEIKFKE